MQTKNDQKTSLYSHNEFDIQIMQIDLKKLNIKISDSLALLKYQLIHYELQNIGVKNVSMALQKQQSDYFKISFDLSKVQNKSQPNLILIIQVQSQLIQLNQQIIFSGGVEISQKQFYQTKIKKFKNQLRRHKQIKYQNYQNSVYYNIELQQKQISSGGYSKIIELSNLKQGKYLFIVSLLVKITTNQGAYIYLNEGETIIQKNGMYIPTYQHFIPISFRKIYIIDSKHPTFSLNTFKADRYGIIIKNAIITVNFLKDIKQNEDIDIKEGKKRKKKNKKIKQMK